MNKLPGDEDIKKAHARVGYQNIVLDDSRLTISFKESGMGLDFGAIAKGYATDMAVKMLEENGINDAIVRAGGNVYCLGKKHENEMWEVGVQHPRHKNRIFCRIRLKGRAIDTSGDYEKYFFLDGKKYSHVIDPITGYPIGDILVSSTVITADAAAADALATAFAVLGDKGIAVAESIKGVDAILVFSRGNNLTVKMTDGIKKRYDISEENL